jgi:adenylate cyclase
MTARFHLRTLGTLALVEHGSDVMAGEPVPQRRRLGLLAVLAASGERGRSRDQLLLLFWPDATQSRARHSLEQLLYAMRTALAPDVFVGVNPIRLNPALVSSDVADFEAAVASGDVEAAASIYGGRFLDGFYLSESPEFEQWVDGERARLERNYVAAMESMASAAERAHDHEAAVRWRQRLADVDQLSSQHAAGLMRAFMATGDYPSALRAAERHQAAVSMELNAPVAPAVAALVSEARARANQEAPAAENIAPTHARPITLDQHPLPGDEPARLGVAHEDRAPVRSQPRLHPGIAALGAMAVLVLVATVVLLRSRDAVVHPAQPDDRSLAVLPLANLSADPRDVHLADGLTEELMGVLARIEHLRVIARSAALAFSGASGDVRRLADSLRVSHLLEGGVQKADSRIRVQLRLIQASDGATLWAQTYDRDVKDIFAVQSDIASSVARELNLRLGRSALARVRRGPTGNVAAYEFYLRGNDPVLLRNDSTVALALEYFSRAVALDSGYAAAYAGLARMHYRISGTAYATMTPREHRAAAERAATKALALNDSLAEVHATLGLLHRIRYQTEAAERELRRAIDLDPGVARYREWLVQLYAATERPEDALREARLAVGLDPLSPTARAELAHALLANDRCEEALIVLDSLAQLRPPLLRAGGLAAECHARLNQWPQAVAAARTGAERASSAGVATLAYMLARSGNRTEAQQMQADLLERWHRTGTGAYEVAVVYAGLGDLNQAFLWLNRSMDEGALWSFGEAPEEMRRDPRFDSIRRRMGIQKR